MTPNQPGVLVLQDLCDVLEQQSFGHGLTANQLMQVGEALAGLHAWSLNHDGWQDEFRSHDKTSFKKFPETNKMMLGKIKEQMSEHFDPAKIDAVLEHSKSVDDVFYAFTMHGELNMPAVLVHGDLWSGNMMFVKETNKDGKVSASDEL